MLYITAKKHSNGIAMFGRASQLIATFADDDEFPGRKFEPDFQLRGSSFLP
jgi:hypothetical protein